MPKYHSRDKWKGGVPLGGIGAGKLEILPNGLLNAFSFQNNWSRPLVGDQNYPGILGFHFGVRVESGKAGRNISKAVLLQTEKIQDIPTVKNIRYDGKFPAATLVYDTQDLGISVSLEAFSAWIPGDVQHSSLPSVFFKFRVKNLKKTPIHFSALFIGRNISGDWCVGRENRVSQNSKTLDLDFLNHDPSPHDPKAGTLRFSFEKKGWTTTFHESWNAVSRNFSFTRDNIRLAAWDEFSEKGELSDQQSRFVASGENQELCGAVSARRFLKPGEEREWLVTANWHFPRHISYGHRYENFFKNIDQVSRYALKKRNALEIKVKKLQELAASFPFPEWLNDALLSTLAPFFAASWHTRDGRFAFYEAPEICPLMGTLDVGFYGSVPLSYFFPELEYSQMTQFAKAQRSSGYIPHDLGRQRLDLPSDGTTFYHWKDLNPKFILMTYRDFFWSRDRARLKEFYPHVKRALEWMTQSDKDQDGLPDHEGADQTFDLWEMKGAHPYTAGLTIAALLACQKMAKHFGDKAFFALCEKRFQRARHSFETVLWNGRFFGETCVLAQLNGQWIADLIGLGLIAEEKKIQTALGSILRMNSAQSRVGFVNSVLANGRLDTSDNHTKNLWVGMNWAFVSLCISRGLPLNESLKHARKVWDNMAVRQKSPWNQPDMIDAKNGRYLFGDFYYRNMAIWSLPIAHAVTNKKTAGLLHRIRSLGSHP